MKSTFNVRTKEWTLVLDQYQRDNLLWLINAIGFPGSDRHGNIVKSVEPLGFCNTDDWLGEVGNALAYPGEDPVLGQNDHPNVSIDQLRKYMNEWAEVKK